MKKTSKHNSEPLATALNYLSGRYVLPSFQRDYVWKTSQIENLFNSIYRGYPIGTMLFWRVNLAHDESLKTESFYRFLTHFEEDKTTQAYAKTALLPNQDYWIVLDGQQRLTSLAIGLLGSYRKRARYQRKNNPDYPEYKMYMLVSEEAENPFAFLSTDKTNNSECYVDETGRKWILARKIFYVDKGRDMVVPFKLSDKEEDRVTDFKDALDRLCIDFSEMTGFDYNEATNVFVVVNSGGTVLEMSDILNSIIVSTWKNVNAKEEFKKLTETVANLGFNINTNYIVKAILYLLHNDVRFQIHGFTDFILEKEGCWNDVKLAIVDTFILLKSYGLNHSTLGGYNATLPILYYIYHKGAKNPATAAAFASDKAIIKQWLLSAILMKLFGRSSDSVLATVRSAFTEKKPKDACKKKSLPVLYSVASSDYMNVALREGLVSFPAGEIKTKLGDDWFMSEETVKKLLTETQKGDRYSLPILSLLYPDYDIEAVEYEQDHLHPSARFDKMSVEFKANKENLRLYNSIVNLQLLQKTPNVQKGDISLAAWVDEQTKGKNKSDREKFFEEHIIPDVSLKEEDVESFFEKRKAMLVERLMKAFDKGGSQAKR